MLKWKSLMLVALGLPLFAQTGLVRLYVSTTKGEPMIQAQVSVLGANGKAEKVVRANRLGQVSLADLPPGPHKLRIEAEGFATQEVPVDVSKNGETKNLQIKMSPKR